MDYFDKVVEGIAEALMAGDYDEADSLAAHVINEMGHDEDELGEALAEYPDAVEAMFDALASGEMSPLNPY